MLREVLMRIFLSFIWLILLTALSGCANTNYGMESYLGTKPFYERYRIVEQGVFYIEVLGNGIADYEMLEEHFSQYARRLCNGIDFKGVTERTTRLKGGTLEDIYLGCVPGKWCPAEEAMFPLVRGKIECEKAI